MEAAQKMASTVGAIAESALEAVQGVRHLSIYVSNGTESPISLSESSGKLCKELFGDRGELRPLSAGVLRLADRGELKAEVKLKLGEEEFLGIWVQVSRLGSVRVLLQFSLDSKLLRGRWLSAPIAGSAHAASAGAEVEGSACSVHVALGTRTQLGDPESATAESRDHMIFEGWDSNRFLHFAEWCSSNHSSGLLGAIFLMEVAAVMMGLEGLALADRAFMLNLLIGAFILNGALSLHGIIPSESLKPDLHRWCLHEPAALSLGRLGYYDAYRCLDQEDESLAEYVHSAVLLLKAAAIRCSIALAEGARVQELLLKDAPAAEDVSRELSDARSSCTADSTSTLHDEMVFRHLGALTMREAATQTTAKSREELTAEARLMRLVRSCVHVSASFSLRWRALFEAAELTLEPDARKSMRRYRSWVPAAVRRYDMGPIDGEDARKVIGLGGKRRHPLCSCRPRRRKTAGVACDAMGSEVFAGLDDGTVASPQAVLESLGTSSLRYKAMLTNSKSGEFFFFSHDRRFLIKTISEEEGKLFFSMLPGYQGHLQIAQESLIVRYAGLFRLDLDGIGTKYFSIMANIFDPSFAIHSTFDVKGSMFKRKKKEGESTGKDVDWVEQEQRLCISEETCSRLCAAHEQDASFLAAYGVMDYSLLIGIHDDFGGEVVDCRGVLSADAKTLYFISIIDFLITYGIRKQFEHFLRFASGHREDASCIDPLSYARRQVRFMRDQVVSVPSKSSKYPLGTFGSLQVQVQAAHSLRVADVAGTSDPYVHVTLGLQRHTTPTVFRNCDPRWDCSLGLAVDEAHVDAEVEFSLWDEDVGALQGSDDFLGRLRVPVADVIAQGVLELHREPLTGVKQGSLSVRLEFVKAPELVYSL